MVLKNINPVAKYNFLTRFYEMLLYMVVRHELLTKWKNRILEAFEM